MTDLAIVVPTYNECGNIEPLLERLTQALKDIRWELIFVDDDSPDGTARTVRTIARIDPRVRCLQRLGRRGLSTAVIEGLLSTSAPVLAVMDADLQHDEAILPAMFRKLEIEDLDLVIGTRYASGGGIAGWDARRAQISRWATRAARSVLRVTPSDPMSGFFMLRRTAFEASMRGLSGHGYKILLDLLASHPGPLKVGEVPYQFRERTTGESKLDARVAWEFAVLLLDKRLGQWASPRLLMFLLVGGSGLIVHYGVLGMTLLALQLPFVIAQTIATLIAMTTNYSLNNLLTYRDRRRRGLRWWTGLASFCAVCGLGMLANVGVASRLFLDQGWIIAAAAGIVVGTAWNFVATAAFTWKRS
jgi:dolichol-phosphate mannosyltransferase